MVSYLPPTSGCGAYRKGERARSNSPFSKGLTRTQGTPRFFCSKAVNCLRAACAERPWGCDSDCGGGRLKGRGEAHLLRGADKNPAHADVLATGAVARVEVPWTSSLRHLECVVVAPQVHDTQPTAASRNVACPGTAFFASQVRGGSRQGDTVVLDPVEGSGVRDPLALVLRRRCAPLVLRI